MQITSGRAVYPVLIYHNPACSNSRGALALIHAAGVEPQIVDYLAEPLSRAALVDLIGASGLAVRDAMRVGDALFGELGLGDPAIGDEALLAALVAHPALLNRPFVVTPRGTRLCRPPERVLDLLPTSLPAAGN